MEKNKGKKGTPDGHWSVKGRNAGTNSRRTLRFLTRMPEVIFAETLFYKGVVIHIGCLVEGVCCEIEL